MDARERDVRAAPDQVVAPPFGISGTDLRRLRETLLRRLVGRRIPRDQAEDAIQDAFVRLCLVERRQLVRNPTGLMISMLRRIRIDRWRAAQRQQCLFVEAPVEALDTADPSVDPSSYVEVGQRLEAIRLRLCKLRPRTRDVFIMHRIQGRTYAEVAAALGISISAVEKHIARAAMAVAQESSESKRWRGPRGPRHR